MEPAGAARSVFAHAAARGCRGGRAPLGHRVGEDLGEARRRAGRLVAPAAPRLLELDALRPAAVARHRCSGWLVDGGPSGPRQCRFHDRNANAYSDAKMACWNHMILGSRWC